MDEQKPIVLHNNFDDTPISLEQGSPLEKFLRTAAPELSAFLERCNKSPPAAEGAQTSKENKKSAIQVSCNLTIETWHRPTEKFFNRLFIAAPQLKQFFDEANDKTPPLSNDKPVRLVLSIQMTVEAMGHPSMADDPELITAITPRDKNFKMDYDHYEAFFMLFLESMKYQERISLEQKEAWRNLSEMFLQEAKNFLHMQNNTITADF